MTNELEWLQYIQRSRRASDASPVFDKNSRSTHGVEDRSCAARDNESWGRGAGGDAGASGDGRWQNASVATAVFRPGDAKPDRAGRNLSAAGSAARSVHVQHQRGISERRRGISNCSPDDAVEDN